MSKTRSALLGRPITYDSDDFVVVAESSESSGIAFQLAPDHVAPTWPDPSVPQQVHLDVMVDDVAAATPLVLDLGATKLPGRDVLIELGPAAVESRAHVKGEPRRDRDQSGRDRSRQYRAGGDAAAVAAARARAFLATTGHDKSGSIIADEADLDPPNSAEAR